MPHYCNRCVVWILLASGLCLSPLLALVLITVTAREVIEGMIVLGCALIALLLDALFNQSSLRDEEL